MTLIVKTSSVMMRKFKIANNFLTTQYSLELKTTRLRTMNILPKLVGLPTSIGVWTDGGMYYDEKGNELKKFHTYDSAGVLWLKKLGLPLCICTGETTLAVERRATKLKVEYLHQGIQNKVEVVKDFMSRIGN